MGFFFKIIGLVVGWQLGRLSGAMVGVFLGHMADLWVVRRQNQFSRKVAVAGEIEQVVLDSTLGMLAKLIIADGKMNREERAAFRKFLKNALKVDHHNERMVIQAFEQGVVSSRTFQMYAVQFYEVFHEHPEMLYSMITYLLDIAMCDGEMAPEEEQLVRSAAQLFQLDEEMYERLASPYRGADLQASYAVLGCTPEDSMQTIKSRYRELVSKFHPDRVASKDLPSEFTEFASQKFRDIQAAYEAIKEEHEAA